MQFRFSTLPQTLMMTLKGMVGIFVVIGVIMLCIWILNKITAAKPTRTPVHYRYYTTLYPPCQYLFPKKRTNFR